jgi:carbon-monoxide dehydrogenase small subunit
MSPTIAFTLNGVARECRSAPLTRLIDALREECELTGTKEGCGEGECGSCTVLIDGQPVNACLVALGQVAGRTVVTVEGIARARGGDALAPIAQCFVDHGGAQCGICTPGMMIAAHELLEANDAPTEAEVREAIAGNLCRCTGYQRIVDSVLEAAKLVRAQKGGAR